MSHGGRRVLLMLAVAVAAALSPPLAAAPRVVTLSPHLAEMVCVVAGCEVLVGVSTYTDHPPAAAARPIIGDPWRVDMEQLLQLRPELVLAWQGGTPERTVARLRDLGFDVRLLPAARLGDIADGLQHIGEWLAMPTRGRAAAAAFRDRLDALRDAVPATATPLRVLYQIGQDPLYVAGAQSPIDEAISLCGGVNVFGDLRLPVAVVGVEAVLARAPQVVVHAGERDAALRAFWARFPTLPAVRDDAFVTVTADWMDRPGPRMLDGVAQLCAGLRQLGAGDQRQR